MRKTRGKGRGAMTSRRPSGTHAVFVRTLLDLSSVWVGEWSCMAVKSQLSVGASVSHEFSGSGASGRKGRKIEHHHWSCHEAQREREKECVRTTSMIKYVAAASWRGLVHSSALNSLSSRPNISWPLLHSSLVMFDRETVVVSYSLGFHSFR